MLKEDEQIVTCMECGAFHTVKGKPLVFIGSKHLAGHDLNALGYLQKHPNAKLSSDSYQRNSRETAKNKGRAKMTAMRSEATKIWNDIFDAFEADGYYPIERVAILLGISRATVRLAADRGVIAADIIATRESNVFAKKAHIFSLFSVNTIENYRKQRG